MSGAALALAPYPGLAAPPGVRLSATASRDDAALALTWRLDAPSGALVVPAPAAAPARRHGLWDATCFEAFLAVPGRPGYWELNLAPSGDWNAFRLTGYRAGLAEEPAVATLPFAATPREGGLDVALRLDLAPLGLAAAPWRVAIAAVLEGPAGALSFWALAHPGAAPDFHHPDAFALALDGPRADG